MKKIILLFILIYSNSFSQTIDVTEIELNFSNDGNPQHITKGINKIYFTADDGDYGEELWVHDKITNSTHRVIEGQEIRNYTFSSYSQFVTIGEILYFTPEYASNEVVLWRSDGTKSGTYMIKSFGNNYYHPLFNLMNFNSTLIFTTKDSVNGNELWISDGTTIGTKLLKDIYEGPQNSNPRSFFIFNDKLFFSADNGISGRELWVSDGTENGTKLLKDINGTLNASVNKLSPIIFGNKFYFYANNVIWSSDGTTDGTQLFMDLKIGLGNSNYDLYGASTKDFFVFEVYSTVIGNELWVSDGTIEGTYLLKDINPGYENSLDQSAQFVALNNKIYFTAYKNTINEQLWETDGTSDGTKLVKGFSGDYGSNIRKLKANKSYMIFSTVGDNSDYYSLWKSDGTTSGTFQLKDIKITETNYNQLDFVDFNNLFFFPAGEDSLNGIELYTTDGTAENTNILLDINHVRSSILLDLDDFAILNDKLIFNGNNGFGNKPFISDGTISGSNMIKDINIASSSGFRAAFYTKSGNSIFFKANDGTIGNEIWKTDGTEENTILVKDINPGKSGSITDNPLFIDFNGLFCFSADDGVNGEELWRSDGTEKGTFLLKDINPGYWSSTPKSNIYSSDQIVSNKNHYAVLKDNLYFTAKELNDISIWKTDGTINGTMKAINMKTFGEPQILNTTNNKIFFVTNYDVNRTDNKLWVTDGTQSGTVQLYPLPNMDTGTFRSSVLLNNNFYFFVKNYNYENALSFIKSDGTVNGTSVVIENLTSDGVINHLLACGNYIYFTLGYDGGTFERQLWRTDGTKNGTKNGTVKLGSVELGSFQNYYNCTCHQNNLIYTKGQFDNKIWHVNENSTDDSAFYEINVINSNNFIEYEGISDFKSVNNTLFFEGTKRQTGSELYSTNFDFDLNSNLNTEGSTNNLNKKLLIYPNPSTNIIKVNIRNNEEITSIKLFDLLGKEVFYSENKSEYNISRIINGIYIIKVFTNKSDYNSKIIIRK